MPRGPSGIYTLPPSYLAVAGETIQPEQHNPPFEDIAQALTDSLPRSGVAPMTGNLQMGGNKVTNLADATADGDAVRLAQIPVAALPLGSNQLWTFHSGGYQRMTISPFMRGVNVSADGPAARTALGLGTLATQNATAVTLAGANPALTLNDTSGTPTTHQILDARYDNSTYSVDVRDSASAFAGRGYEMTTNASGAVSHTLRVATTDRLVVNSSGVGVTGVLSVTGNVGVAGNITPVGGNRDLGTFLNPWQNLHVVNSLVQSDERKKKNFGEFSKADFAAALKIKFQPFTLRADGRETSGYVAQQIIAAFGGEARPMQLGLIHKSEDGFYSVSYELVNGLRIEARG